MGRPHHPHSPSVSRTEQRPMPEPLLDAEGAARLLCVPKSWVLAQARDHRIPHVRLGKYVRFERSELEAWWCSRRRGPRRAGSGPARMTGEAHEL
jgi:excisionase family DNA binding protein